MSNKFTDTYILDDELFRFGTDGDFSWDFDSASGEMHLKDASSNTLCTIANAAGTVTQTWTGNGVLSGDIAVNGGDLTSTATTFNLLDGTVTTLNIGGAATVVDIGAASGTTTIKNDLTVDGATSIAGLTLTGDLAVNGGDLTSTATTFNLLDGTVTTLNFGGAATVVDIGAATGTTTIKNDLTVDGATSIAGLTLTGDLAVNGGDFTSTATTFNFLDGTVTTLNLGGAATVVDIGAATGTTTIKNDAQVDGNLTIGNDALAPWLHVDVIDAGTSNYATVSVGQSPLYSGWMRYQTTGGAEYFTLGVTSGGSPIEVLQIGRSGTPTLSVIRDADFDGDVNIDGDITDCTDIDITGSFTSTLSTNAYYYNTITNVNTGGITTASFRAENNASNGYALFGVAGASHSLDLDLHNRGFVAIGADLEGLVFKTVGATQDIEFFGNDTLLLTLDSSTGGAILVGDFAVNGGDITTTATTTSIFNTTATTINIGGAATAVNIGHSSGTGTTAVDNSLQVSGIATFIGRLDNPGASAFADGDATPSVTASNTFTCGAQTTPTAITSLDDGTDGQEVFIVAIDGDTTMTDGGNLKLAGNWTPGVDDTITLRYDGSNWFEKCRSNN